MKRIIVGLITVYQKTISPDHGVFKHRHPNGFCKYYPSCSEYTKQSVEKHGILGLFKGIYRVLRCNPWSQGGIDLA
ncbi:MAG: membrane protein insertion efficiency factor YidD [Patescibacteria group bacterium]